MVKGKVYTLKKTYHESNKRAVEICASSKRYRITRYDTIPLVFYVLWMKEKSGNIIIIQVCLRFDSIVHIERDEKAVKPEDSRGKRVNASACSGSWAKTICHCKRWYFNWIESFSPRQTITQLVWPITKLIRIKPSRIVDLKSLPVCGLCKINRIVIDTLDQNRTVWVSPAHRLLQLQKQQECANSGVDKWLIKFSVKVENYDCVINVCVSLKLCFNTKELSDPWERKINRDRVW